MAKKNNDDALVKENTKHETGLKDEFVEDESLTGDMPALESDDDTLENAHDMGLYRNDQGDNPQELNLAAEVQKAEDNRRGIG